jgi:hypothetical protein
MSHSRHRRNPFRRWVRRFDKRFGYRRRVRLVRGVVATAVGLAILGDIAFLAIAAGGGGGGGSEPVAAAKRAGPAKSTSTTENPDKKRAAALKAFRERLEFTATSTVPKVPLSALAGLAPKRGPVTVAGGGATVTSDPAACVWEPAAGGTLRAAGMVTNLGSEEDTWLVDVTWNDSDGYFDSESDFVDTGPRQAKPWSITLTGAGEPAAPLTCAVEAL